jgi:hypothetical protein
MGIFLRKFFSKNSGPPHRENAGEEVQDKSVLKGNKEERS